MYAVVQAFKPAWLCCPRFVKVTKRGTDAVVQLRAFPMLDSYKQIHVRKRTSAAADIPKDENWWRHPQKLHAWKEMARLIMAIPSSSAAAERVFSLLAATVGTQQHPPLELSIILLQRSA